MTWLEKKRNYYIVFRLKKSVSCKNKTYMSYICNGSCWHPLKNLNKLSTDTKCYIDDFNLALVFYNVIFAWHGTEATWCWVNIKQILRRIFTNVILKCSRVTNLVQSSKQITRERSSVRAVFWRNNVISKEHNEKDTTVNLKLIALPVS